MAFVLTTASAITCPNQGTVDSSGQPKLTVEHSPVVRLDGIVGKDVTGCTVLDGDSTKKCRKVAEAHSASTKLKVNGQGVALESLTGMTDGTPPELSASADQTKLQAV